jgi:hypothetical protein
MGKDFHAAFSNMNKAVRPGVGQSAVVQLLSQDSTYDTHVPFQ